MDSLSLSYAVMSAQKQRAPDGPFPAARDLIFGTAFAIAPDLFLTAGHVAQAAAEVGDVALGRLGNPVGNGRFDVVSDYEIFESIDVALLHCEGFDPRVYEVSFDHLPIFQEVRSVGFGIGLDPEYHAYTPRGFIGHVVSGHQLFRWRAQPLAYEVSFIPPAGMSGAALVPDGYGAACASGIVLGSQVVRIEGNTTRLGIALAADELLRVTSRLIGGPLATLFNKEPLPARELIGPVSERLANYEAPGDDEWPED